MLAWLHSMQNQDAIHMTYQEKRLIQTLSRITNVANTALRQPHVYAFVRLRRMEISSF